MKIGVITELLRKPILESIDYAASIGAQGVQIYAAHGDEGYNFVNCTAKEIATLRNRCDANKLEISAVCGDISNLSLQVDYQWQPRVEVLKKVLNTVAALECTVMTSHIGCIPESVQDPVYANMVRGVREAADYAHKLGCKFAIETGPELADVLLRFINDVASEGVAINLDPANLRGVSCEDPAYAVRTLGKYIVHTHAKDSVNTHVGSAAKFYGMRNPDGSYREISARAAGFKEVPLGQGMVNWPEYIAALREVGFDGFLTIERECGDDPVADITMAIDFLKKQLA